MEIKAIKTKVFHETEALLPFIEKYVKKLSENSILVITSKIVALSEGRTVVCNSEKQKTALIKQESDFAFKTKLVWLTIKNRMVMANAGIDESNGNGKLVLLPKDSFRAAEIVCEKLKKIFKIKNLGVIISDSGFLPLRSGVIAIALGYAGFKGIRSYEGKKDTFGRKFKYQKTNVADSLATMAALSMGEGNERRPLAIIKNPNISFTKNTNKKEIVINPRKDIFYPLLQNIKNAKK